MNIKIKKLNPIILPIIFITLSLFIVTFTIFYTQENFSPVCGCKLPIWVIIISIFSFGIFSGSLIYYVINKNLLEEKKHVKVAIDFFLNLIEKNEKKVLRLLINNSGEIYQSKITKEFNNDKVKVSRTINNLEKKGIIVKEKKGMTNLIKLNNDILKSLRSFKK